MPATFVTTDFHMPMLPPTFQAAPAFVALVTLADSNDKAGWLFRVPHTGNTKAFGFRITTLTTPVDLLASLQDVSLTAGTPDGVADQSVVLTSGALTTGWNVTGTLTRAVTRGQLLSAVLESNGGTPNIVISAPQYTAGIGIDFPYVIPFTTAWGTKIGRFGCFGLQYDDNIWYPMGGQVYPFTAFNTPTFNSGSSPDERGNLIIPPFTCKVDGGWLIGDIDGDADIVLYDSGGSVLSSVSVDKDVDANNSPGLYYHDFAEVTLTGGSTYYHILKPTSATDCQLQDYEFPSTAVANMLELGTNCYFVGRTDAGAWSPTTTKRAWMGLHVSAVQTDPGTAVGGVSRGRFQRRM